MNGLFGSSTLSQCSCYPKMLLCSLFSLEKNIIFRCNKRWKVKYWECIWRTLDAKKEKMLFCSRISGMLSDRLLTGWLMDWWVTVPTASSQHHAASGLNSSWLSWSWILIHEIKSWSQGRGACLLAAWSSLKHLLYIQTKTQKNRKSSSDMWAFGPVARAFFPSKINEAQRCQLFPFNSPQ